MKKSLILGVFGLAATVATTLGQGLIQLDNYDSSAHPLVTYGAGTDGTLGAGVGSAYTVGLYFVNSAGNFTGNFNSDPSGNANPASLYNGSTGQFVLGAGPGATGAFDTIDAGFTPGEYAPTSSFNPGLGAGSTVTMMIIAYEGSSYASAQYKGHSAAFTMTTSTGTAFPNLSGDAGEAGFSVVPIPEPSIFALAGMGAAALMAIRRKK